MPTSSPGTFFEAEALGIERFSLPSPKPLKKGIPTVVSVHDFADWIRLFAQRPEVAEPLSELMERLPGKAVPYIVGGALRDQVIERVHGNAPATRDVDLFIGGVDPGRCLEAFFEGQRFESTELGGIRWFPEHSGYAFDVCMLSRFIVLEKYALAADAQTLLSVLDFNVNAAVYDPRAGILHQNRFLEAILERTLDFNTRLFFDHALLIYRILAIRHKLRFRLSADIFHFLKRSVDIATLDRVRLILVSKRGGREAKAVLKAYDRICAVTDYESYLKIWDRLE